MKIGLECIVKTTDPEVESLANTSERSLGVIAGRLAIRNKKEMPITSDSPRFAFDEGRKHLKKSQKSWRRWL